MRIPFREDYVALHISLVKPIHTSELISCNHLSLCGDSGLLRP